MVTEPTRLAHGDTAFYTRTLSLHANHSAVDNYSFGIYLLILLSLLSFSAKMTVSPWAIHKISLLARSLNSHVSLVYLISRVSLRCLLRYDFAAGRRAGPVVCGWECSSERLAQGRAGLHGAGVWFR
jgi:hypothetical protein